MGYSGESTYLKGSDGVDGYVSGKNITFSDGSGGFEGTRFTPGKGNNIFRHIIMMVHRQKRTQVITLGNKINIMFISIFCMDRERERVWKYTHRLRIGVIWMFNY